MICLYAQHFPLSILIILFLNKGVLVCIKYFTCKEENCTLSIYSNEVEIVR
jgi:hypothetical protein